uniref:acyclic terpene utilization AtuA family protein n=1 Tax=Billgrantia saliphila TaxID=1848458 RepID=UPI0012DD29B0
MTVVIGCGAGFSGDRTDAAGPLVEALLGYDAPRALMFETLGERTLAAAQLRRVQDPEGGDEPLLDAFLAPVLGKCLAHGISVLGN